MQNMPAMMAPVTWSRRCRVLISSPSTAACWKVPLWQPSSHCSKLAQFGLREEATVMRMLLRWGNRASDMVVRMKACRGLVSNSWMSKWKVRPL